jgi:CheY-like chemotaxis protein
VFLWGLLMAASVGVAVPVQSERSSISRHKYGVVQTRISTLFPVQMDDLLLKQGGFFSPVQLWEPIPSLAVSCLYLIAALPHGFRSLVFTICALFATGVLMMGRFLQQRHRHHEQHLASMIDAKAKELRSYEELLRSSRDRLKAANEAVKSANHAKAVFLANMTHDLRTPLNSILGYTQLLLRDSNRKPSSHSYLNDGIETQRKLAMILASGEQMLEMINHLVERAKVESDYGSSVPELQEIVGYKGPVRKLLILDDDLVSRTFLRELLDAVGFTITEASSTKEALRLASGQAFDGLIADLRIPRIDGQSICRLLRSQSNRSNLALIASSASSAEAERDYAIVQGFNEFVAKPVMGRALLGVLARHLKLDWVIRPNQESSQSTPIFANSEQAIVQPLDEPVPSADVLTQLLRSARRGDVIVLREEINKIRASGEHFHLFCDRLNVVLTEFRMSAIEQIVNAALNQSSLVEGMQNENGNGRRRYSSKC